METNRVEQNSAYQGCLIHLCTKHAKSTACAPAFWDILGAHVVESIFDTDSLGTFTGEVARDKPALECARLKCEWALSESKEREFALASEGSFGPHPVIPFVACNHELLYFIDKKRKFHLHIATLTETTNFQAKTVDNREQLLEFAHNAKFPSHGLIVAPNSTKSCQFFKGLVTLEALENAFSESCKASADKKAHVQTDMRANYNPTRMTVISQLATTLATRLSAHCPACTMPGWGIIQVQKGLRCQSCHNPTELVNAHILGCAVCDHKKQHIPPDMPQYADAQFCPSCNP